MRWIEPVLARVPRLYRRLVRLRRAPNAEKLVFLSAVRAGDTVFDVGANTGYYTVLFSHLVGRRGCVHGFEPVAPTMTYLVITVGADDSKQEKVKFLLVIECQHLFRHRASKLWKGLFLTFAAWQIRY
jgi:hypothetical protein